MPISHLGYENLGWFVSWVMSRELSRSAGHYSRRIVCDPSIVRIVKIESFPYTIT